MSELVCYLERSERGVLPVRVRLVSTRVDETWAFPDVLADDRAALERGLAEAADWIAGQLKTHARGGLGALVLDADGARCGWVTAPTPDAESIGAVLQQAAQPVSEEDAAHTVGSTPQLALGPDAQINGGRSIQPLGVKPPEKGGLFAKPAAAGGQARARVGVAAVPDATVRLLLDELDARGVDVARVVTVWHALSEAFETPTGGGGLVTSEHSTNAQVMVDAGSGRLLWAWTRGGTPIAAGSFRVPHGAASADGPGGVAVGRAELGRLASEWIGWSTQLGASPTRLRVLVPDDVWQDESSLGEAVSGLWSGATSDIAFDEDPLATVLVRFADGLADPRVGDAGRESIARLQGRPGRQHRSMYRWSAVALALAAVVMGVVAYKVRVAAGAIDAQAAAKQQEWKDRIGEVYPTAVDPSFPRADVLILQDFEGELARRKAATAPLTVTPEKPVLQELETLALVLGNPEYRLEQIDLGATAVTLDVVVPDTAAYEELLDAVRSIGGSNVTDWEANARSTPNGVRASLVGLWASEPRTGPGGA